MVTSREGRILVVEDDDGMREAIESLLAAAGFETAAYASAEAFFAAGPAEDSLCVISDLKLPLMSGFDLLSELRTRGPRPPVIMITAHDAPAERIEAERRGAAAFLAKPFAGSVLLAAIESVAGTEVRKCS
jgi:FixJ family two-component response regulator